jgi:hypothetical protein
MATTTPNFGWAVPTSTDLVKDGAVAIETLGDSIDASLVDLKGGTTGQVLAKASGTDMDFSWVAIDPLVILDAKGDLITATAADTPARLAVGTNGQTLVADSTASTGLKWATPTSGLTFITGAAFSAVASVSLPNSTFTSTYTNYKLVFNITSAAGAAAETRFRMRASGTDDTAANYYMGGMTVTYTAVNTAVNTNGGTYIPYGSIAAGSGGISSQSTQFEMTLFSPQTSSATVFTTMGGRGSWTWTAQTGVNNSSTAFDSLTYYVDAGTITGNYRVYGYQNS